MSVYQETMRQWRRICKIQDNCSDRDVCVTCPIGMEIGVCSAFYKEDMDYATVRDLFKKWAAKNPEPMYPTWADWLIRQGILVITTTLLPRKYYTVDERKITEPIPADIAEKLGIQPFPKA